ncbi:hypothetical protein ANTRET_LOCUS9737 [Anthophora retusa]
MKEEAINGQVTERKGILNYAARLGFARLLASFLYNYREIRCQLPILARRKSEISMDKNSHHRNCPSGEDF